MKTNNNLLMKFYVSTFILLMGLVTIPVNAQESAVVKISTQSGRAIELTGKAALYEFSRTGSTGALSVGFELGSGYGPANVQPKDDDFDLVYADSGEVVTNNTLHFLEGQASRIIEVQPRLDDRAEALQRMSITLLDGDSYTVERVGRVHDRMIAISEAPDTVENEQHFVGTFQPFDDANTNASGVLNVVLNGSNTRAKLSYSFDNLSGGQQGQFIDAASGGSASADLPSGSSVVEYVFDIKPNAALETRQETLDALLRGNLSVRILSAEFPEGEISAVIQRDENSIVEFIPEADVTQENLSQEQVDIDIIRFLNQSTFGATEESYNELRAQIGDNGDNRLAVYEDWIDTQLDMPATNMDDLAVSLTDAVGVNVVRFEREDSFWTLAINSPDQLRHRLAQSLSEILVVSDEVAHLRNAYRGMTTYWDMLASSGSGTYEELLGDVTRHSTMAGMLSYIQNRKANPDENYAREVMQLFSFGLFHLNQDGSMVLDNNGEPIQTYNNDVVREMARVFTGLSYSRRVESKENPVEIENTRFGVNEQLAVGNQAQWTNPLIFFTSQHDFDEKTLWADQGEQITISASETSIAAADEELDKVIDALVEHSSTAPRISRLLIQQLVTSNPSGEYIERVADAFGEDGDIRATLKAILLDEEARDTNLINDRSFGKQKTPIQKTSSFMRVADASSNFYIDGRNNGVNFINANRFDGDATHLRINSSGSASHRNLRALSVFNFYSPTFSPQGSLADNSLVGPEFELLTEAAQTVSFNYFRNFIDSGQVRSSRSAEYDLSLDDQRVTINRDRLQAIFDDAPGDDSEKAGALVDYLDFYFNASLIALTNDVSGTRDIIINAVVDASDDDRLAIAIYSVVNAPESQVQK